MTTSNLLILKSNSMKLIAIILARGGSKSVPKKNIKNLCGKPLIAHTIYLANKLQLFNNIIVSSDDLEILKIAKENGAEIIVRPKQFASDNSSSESAIIHALQELKKMNKNYDAVVLLEPTSPLRKIETVRDAIEKFKTSDYTTLISVVEDYSTFWVPNKNKQERLFPNQSRRRQERLPLYREVGVIYISKVNHILTNSSFISDNLHTYITDPIESIDINNEIDFEIAEIIMNNINSIKF
jgi:CMP-N,N'-diacetyllegionaminic acid synthase